MQLSPIVLFVYNRPWHTRQTLEALAANYTSDESQLFVFADGPKPGASPDDLRKIDEVRALVYEKQWCGKVELTTSPTNKGLAASVIAGVTEIVDKHGRVIVLEDDLLTSPWFLTYMNEGLELYNNVQNVYSVNGYMFPIETEKSDTVLLPYTSTWGWGTWKEKWSVFEMNPELNKVIDQNPFLRQRFNLADYDYTNMLINAKHSWGIHWYFSVFVRNGLGVFPTKSLVQNIGFDGSGVNCGNTFFTQFYGTLKVSIHKESTLDLDFYSRYINHFIKTREKVSMYSRILKKLKRLIYG